MQPLPELPGTTEKRRDLSPDSSQPSLLGEDSEPEASDQEPLSVMRQRLVKSGVVNKRPTSQKQDSKLRSSLRDDEAGPSRYAVLRDEHSDEEDARVSSAAAAEREGSVPLEELFWRSVVDPIENHAADSCTMWTHRIRAGVSKHLSNWPASRQFLAINNDFLNVFPSAALAVLYETTCNEANNVPSMHECWDNLVTHFGTDKAPIFYSMWYLTTLRSNALKAIKGLLESKGPCPFDNECSLIAWLQHADFVDRCGLRYQEAFVRFIFEPFAQAFRARDFLDLSLRYQLCAIFMWFGLALDIQVLVLREDLEAPTCYHPRLSDELCMLFLDAPSTYPWGSKTWELHHAVPSMEPNGHICSLSAFQQVMASHGAPPPDRPISEITTPKQRSPARAEVQSASPAAAQTGRRRDYSDDDSDCEGRALRRRRRVSDSAQQAQPQRRQQQDLRKISAPIPKEQAHTAQPVARSVQLEARIAQPESHNAQRDFVEPGSMRNDTQDQRDFAEQRPSNDQRERDFIKPRPMRNDTRDDNSSRRERERSPRRAEEGSQRRERKHSPKRAFQGRNRFNHDGYNSTSSRCSSDGSNRWQGCRGRQHWRHHSGRQGRDFGNRRGSCDSQNSFASDFTSRSRSPMSRSPKKPYDQRERFFAEK